MEIEPTDIMDKKLKPASYLDRISGNIVARAQKKTHIAPKSPENHKNQEEKAENAEKEVKKTEKKPKTEPETKPETKKTEDPKKTVEPKESDTMELKILKKLAQLEVLIKEKDSEIDFLKEEIAKIQGKPTKTPSKPAKASSPSDSTPVPSDTNYRGRHERSSK